MFRFSYSIALALLLCASLSGSDAALNAQEQPSSHPGDPSPRKAPERPAGRAPGDSHSPTTKSPPAPAPSRSTPPKSEKVIRTPGSESSPDKAPPATESAEEAGRPEKADPELLKKTKPPTDSQSEKETGQPAARPARRVTPPPGLKKEQKRPSVPLSKQDGIADDFRPFPDTIIPGARVLLQTQYPHQEEGGDLMKIMRFDEPVQKPERGGEPNGFWDRLAARVGSEKTVINILLLVALVVIFGWYRLRGRGLSRKRFE